MQNNFSNQIISFLKDYFSPLVNAFESPNSALYFFKAELGWHPENIFVVPSDPAAPDPLFTLVEEVPNIIKQIIAQLESPTTEDSIPGFVDMISKSDFAKIFKAISDIPKLAINPAISHEIDIKDLILDILNWLTLTYLGNYQLKIYNILNLLKIIDASHVIDEKTAADGKMLRYANYVPKISFDKLDEIIKTKNISDLFQFDTVDEINAISGSIIEPLVNLVNSIGVFCVYGTGEIPSAMGNTNPRRHDSLVYFEKNWLTGELVEKVAVTLGLLLNSESEGGPGIFVNPNGSLAFSYNKKGWIITAVAKIGVPFKINKQGLIPLTSGIIDPTITLQGSYAPLFGSSNKAFQFGKSTESNISIQTIKATVFGDFNNSTNKDTVSYGISAEMVDCIITLKVDNAFIKAIIPEDAHVKFNFEIGYSSKNGFHFKGSGGLDIQLAQNITIGPIQLKDTRLSVKPVEDPQKLKSGLGIIIGTNISALLGPLTVAIKEFGLKTDIEFPSDGTGNLGLINLKPDIKFPTGVGLSLNTDAVKAGGFLELNLDKGEYFGAIEIEIKPIKLAIKAVGIINTKFPGTQEQSFSLLIIITTEFSPVQLGFGFTLEGVGGLFGYKRTMLADVLREGLKNKTLDTILFPKDVVKNVNKVVTDLKSVFPATQNERFLISPMAKIGWGGSMVTAQIGIIIELPQPVKIAILGVVRVILPDEQAEILKLQINFLGTIDFEKKLIAIDANLEDSRILKTLTLTGQFAIRIGWGSNPLFIFSAGGFHPDFKEDVGLPNMTRLGIVIFDKPNLKLRIESYFALTTNTLQFGARAYCSAQAGPFSVNVVGGFDALIQFKPFQFTASVSLTGTIIVVDLKVVVDVSANLSGPNVWHLWGSVMVRTLIPLGPIPFDVYFGDKIPVLPPPAIDVLELLLEELKIDSNWTAHTQGNPISPKVKLREIPAAVGIVLHPNTTLSFNQRLVPLEIAIQKFGDKVPKGDNWFKIKEIKIPATAILGILREKRDTFAPGLFWDIPKERQLSSPSFQSLKSGVSFNIGTSQTMQGNGSPIISTNAYKPVYVKKKSTTSYQGTTLTPTQSAMLATGGAASKSSLSYENNRSSHQAPEAVRKTEQGYIVASTKDLNNVSGTTTYQSQAEAYEMQQSKHQKDTIILSTYE